MTEWEKFELWLDEIVGSGAASRIAAAMQISGWRPPARVIETVEELEALPVGAVVHGRFRWDYETVETIAQRDTPSSDGVGRWCFPGIHYSFDDSELWERSESEITVLWESGDPR